MNSLVCSLQDCIVQDYLCNFDINTVAFSCRDQEIKKEQGTELEMKVEEDTGNILSWSKIEVQLCTYLT